MAPFQLVAALIEVAWQCFERLPTVKERLAACLDAILGVALPALERTRAKRAALQSDMVHAVFEHFGPQLKPIFRSYAAADQSASLADASTADSLNLPELQFMMKEGGMVDDSLTVLKLKEIFAEVNNGSEEDGIDDDADELVYDEFIMVLAMICDVKIPEARRGGEPFEYTLQAWLQARADELGPDSQAVLTF